MRWHNGFSLAEMAIVLVIVGILMASGLGALSSQMSNQRIKEAKLMLERTNEALMGYALSHNRLPCPAVIKLDGSSDGAEGGRDATSKLCSNAEGALPWLELGLPPNDPWGRPLRYRVTLEFTKKDTVCGDPGASSSAPCFGRTTAGDNKVKTISGTQLLSASLAAAVVFSEGENGTSTHAGESENRGITANQFVQDVPTPDTIAPDDSSKAFDDILVWLPINTLIYRFSALGVWNN